MGDEGAAADVGQHKQSAATGVERRNSHSQSTAAPSVRTEPIDYAPEDSRQFNAFSRAQTSIDVEDYFVRFTKDLW